MSCSKDTSVKTSEYGTWKSITLISEDACIMLISGILTTSSCLHSSSCRNASSRSIDIFACIIMEITSANIFVGSAITLSVDKTVKIVLASRGALFISEHPTNTNEEIKVGDIQ
ncbi:hypothetical protein DsansV1_C01g0006451 [Dioscorea sansibarensis]